MRIDAHQDLLYSLSPYRVSEREKPFVEKAQNQTGFDLLKKSNLDIVFSALFEGENNIERLKEILKHHQNFLENKKNDFYLIDGKDKFLSVSDKNKIGLIFHIEGLAGGLDDIDYFFENSVRSIGLTHNLKNQFASGCSDLDGGLTDFGKKVVKKITDKKMLIDLSHLNEKSFYDVLSVAKGPLIASHSNCFSICPNERNLRDNQIKEIAKFKGAIGIFFSGKYLKPDGDSRASLRDVILHIKHIVSLVGVDCVGIGSDFGGIISGVPIGLEDASKFDILEKELKNSGFSDEETAKIMGGNFYKILNNIFC